MRHSATIELLNDVEVHDKLAYFNYMGEKGALTYSDIMSAGREKTISAYFSTDDGDKGRIVFEDKVIKLSVDLSFTRLVSLYDLTEENYPGGVVDLVEKESNPNYPPSDDEPIETA